MKKRGEGRERRESQVGNKERVLALLSKLSIAFSLLRGRFRRHQRGKGAEERREKEGRKIERKNRVIDGLL